MRHYLGTLFAVVILIIPWFAFTYPNEARSILILIQNAGSQFAAVILSHNPKTITDLRSNYSAPADNQTTVQKKVRILLVPGHEPGYGGAEFADIKERNLATELARDLREYIQNNNHYQVFTTRDDTAWSPEFAAYFKNNWDSIKEWQKASHDELSHLIAVGSVTPPASKVFHNNAPQDVALRLYGITKWSNENNIDIAIHIHFNDHPGHKHNISGTHSGFAIYVPAKQYGNSVTTKAVAGTIFKRLAKYNPVSDLSGESGGIVDDPELIAVGANNTADAASMLIEYGYIYEPQILDPKIRSLFIKDLAFQTYLGLQDFFDQQNVVSMSGSFDTLVMPHEWGHPMTEKNVQTADVFALQTALLIDGVYPPAQKSKNDCPRSGSFGPCTKKALGEFQKKYNINGENGVVGEKTIEELNRRYSGKII